MPSRIFLVLITPHRFWRIVQLSEKQLPTNPAVGRLKNMVEEVKLTVPVVADLLSGTLTSRHWEELNRVLGVDVREQGAATFKQMMKVKLHTVKKKNYPSIFLQFVRPHTTVELVTVCRCLQSNSLGITAVVNSIISQSEIKTLKMAFDKRPPQSAPFVGQRQGRIRRSELHCHERRARIHPYPAIAEGELWGWSCGTNGFPHAQNMGLENTFCCKGRIVFA